MSVLTTNSENLPSSSSTTPTDVAIIGAGPVGLFGVFACGMLGLKAEVIDALPEIGGQCTALYPEKPIYDIPAYPMIKGKDLVAALEEQAAPFSPHYHLNQAVTAITRQHDGIFALLTTKSKTIYAKTVLIAAGAGAFGPNRPPLANLEDYENRSVFYTVRNPDQWAKKTIVIAGGGDSAIDWVNILSKIAEKIYLVHRRDHFRAAPHSLTDLNIHIQSGKVEKVIPAQLSGLTGQNGQITHVQITDLNGTNRSLKADGLLCFYGLSTSLGILSNMDLAIQGNQIIVDGGTSATSLSGLYAAGDIAFYPHKQKLILTGFSEISQAAQAIYTFIHPDKPRHHEHSTTKGLPSKENL